MFIILATGLQCAVWWPQQEVTRPKARFKPTSSKKSVVDGGAFSCQHVLVSIRCQILHNYSKSLRLKGHHFVGPDMVVAGIEILFQILWEYSSRVGEHLEVHLHLRLVLRLQLGNVTLWRLETIAQFLDFIFRPEVIIFGGQLNCANICSGQSYKLYIMTDCSQFLIIIYKDRKFVTLLNVQKVNYLLGLCNDQKLD